MKETPAKFPRLFVCLFVALMLAMFVSCFFSLLSVANIYFCMLLLVVVFILFDKKYNFFIANYKVIFTVYDLSTIMALVSILVYEYLEHSLTLNIFLFILAGVEIVVLLLDFLFLQNNFLTKKECLIVDFAQICLMICMLTYFYGVSSYWYSVVAVLIEIVIAMIKCYYIGKLKNMKPKNETTLPQTDLEKTINKIEKDDEHWGEM